MAIQYYDKALAIQPNNAGALNSKATAIYHLGNYTGAIQYVDKALAIDPKNILALNNKAVFLDSLGNHTGALEYLLFAVIIRFTYSSRFVQVVWLTPVLTTALGPI